jgi:hypothetical protein
MKIYIFNTFQLLARTESVVYWVEQGFQVGLMPLCGNNCPYFLEWKIRLFFFFICYNFEWMEKKTHTAEAHAAL